MPDAIPSLIHDRPRLHLHVVPTRIHSRREVGERWCFRCRARVPFWLSVHVPTDPMSYYGPHATVECDREHRDGDLFPGRVREWDDA